MLQNKKILLGISGGIAAYKTPELVRLFIKAGAEVQVVMTKAATRFVSPETLSVLSKKRVLVDFFTADNEWNNHVALAEWADIILIAPLTANTLAKLTQGQCDNLLLSVYLSARCNVFVAPAMDLEMYQHVTVQQNLKVLRERGHLIIPAEKGELASGLIGEGRMAEPATIFKMLADYYVSTLPLAGKIAVVNAGPTFEAIDPVRYIGNRSSGKMGVAIADALQQMGATVHLILGPSNQVIPNGISVERVESSDDMLKATLAAFNSCDIAVCSAAVADYKPAEIATEKLKKTDKLLTIQLQPTIDIIAELGKIKTRQLLIGFALETNNLQEYAADKLKRKNMDMIVANAADAGGGVFGNDLNKITIITKHNKSFNFELKSKKEAALDIVNTIIDLIETKEV